MSDFEDNELDVTEEPDSTDHSGELHKTIHLSGMYENWFLDYASYVILERAVLGLQIEKREGRFSGAAGGGRTQDIVGWNLALLLCRVGCHFRCLSKMCLSLERSGRVRGMPAPVTCRLVLGFASPGGKTSDYAAFFHPFPAAKMRLGDVNVSCTPVHRWTCR